MATTDTADRMARPAPPPVAVVSPNAEGAGAGGGRRRGGREARMARG